MTSYRQALAIPFAMLYLSSPVQSQEPARDAIARALPVIATQSSSPDARMDLEAKLSSEGLQAGCGKTRRLPSASITLCASKGGDPYFITVLESQRSLRPVAAQGAKIGPNQIKFEDAPLYAEPITVTILDYGQDGVGSRDHSTAYFENQGRHFQTQSPMKYTLENNKTVQQTWYVECNGKPRTVMSDTEMLATFGKGISSFLKVFGLSPERRFIQNLNRKYAELILHDQNPSLAERQAEKIVNGSWEKIAEAYHDPTTVREMQSCQPTYATSMRPSKSF